MNVLILNGSPRANGNTAAALAEMEKIFAQNGIGCETVQVGQLAIRGCVACGACSKTGKCAIDDIVNEVAAKFEACDGLVVASPVYYASANSTLTAFLDRLFYAASSVFAHKPGAAVASARRAGTTASLDVMNKYFTIAQMPVVSSQYWNMVHGNTPEEVKRIIGRIILLRF